MTQNGLSYTTLPDNQKNLYLYNGKELQKDFGLDWYDYGARFYNAELGRFTGIDALADTFVWVTPYNYAENSPIANVDLWGLQAVPFQGVMATFDKKGYSRMVDQRNKAMEKIDVKLSVSAGLQAGGSFNKKGAYINVASADLVSASGKNGFNYIRENKKTHITQGASLFVFSFDHSFDGKSVGYENEKTSFTVLNTNFSLDKNNKPQTDNSKKELNSSNDNNSDFKINIKPDYILNAAFFLGIKLEVTIQDEK